MFCIPTSNLIIFEDMELSGETRSSVKVSNYITVNCLSLERSYQANTHHFFPRQTIENIDTFSNVKFCCLNLYNTLLNSDRVIG